MSIELEELVFARFDSEHPMNDRQRSRFLELLEASFPAYERRTAAGQELLFRQPEYVVFAALLEGEILAFLTWWEMQDFRYVEHFASDPALRGQGLGGRMLDRFLKMAESVCVLEVELPETDVARRRIGFYRRHGFELCPFDYMQPPLRPGDEPTPLALMATQELERPQFEHARDALYARVYTCGTDLA